jgi:hypothetical protein
MPAGALGGYRSIAVLGSLGSATIQPPKETVALLSASDLLPLSRESPSSSAETVSKTTAAAKADASARYTAFFMYYPFVVNNPFGDQN